jgi:hypothetical protein
LGRETGEERSKDLSLDCFGDNSIFCEMKLGDGLSLLRIIKTKMLEEYGNSNNCDISENILDSRNLSWKTFGVSYDGP